MADKLNFELVSPEKRLAEETCDMVVIPGEEGDFGVLVDHAPMVALVRPGVVEVYQGDKVEKRFFIAGGFCEVSPDGCVLLTDEGLGIEELNRELAERRLDNAKRDHDEIEEEGPAKDRASRSVRVAEAMVAAGVHVND